MRIKQIVVLAFPQQYGHCATCILDFQMMVRFAWYSFTRVTFETDKQGKPQRVLRGELKNTEILQKTVAASDPRYSRMFEKLGRFKQARVIAATA